MRFLIIFIFLITNSFANENPNIKNLIISKEPVKHASLTFLNSANKQITLDDYVGNLIIFCSALLAVLGRNDLTPGKFFYVWFHEKTIYV